MPETSLRVATFAAGSWQLLPGAVVDTAAKTRVGLDHAPVALRDRVGLRWADLCSNSGRAAMCARHHGWWLRRAVHGRGYGSGRSRGVKRQGRRLGRDVHGADLRRRVERLRGVSGRGAGRLHRQRQRLLRRLLLSVRWTDLLRHLGCWRSLRRRRSVAAGRAGPVETPGARGRAGPRGPARRAGPRRPAGILGRAGRPAPRRLPALARPPLAPRSRAPSCRIASTEPPATRGPAVSTRAARSASPPAQREAAQRAGRVRRLRAALTAIPVRRTRARRRNPAPTLPTGTRPRAASRSERFPVPKEIEHRNGGQDRRGHQRPSRHRPHLGHRRGFRRHDRRGRGRDTFEGRRRHGTTRRRRDGSRHLSAGRLVSGRGRAA